MKTKTINVYTLEELPKEAQDKAYQEWKKTAENPFLTDILPERLHELLEANKIKDLNDTSKPGTRPTPVYYSLGYSQGDGVMFEGTFEYKDHVVVIEHYGRYSHSNSKTNTWEDFSGEEKENEEEEIAAEFETLYQKICKELETYGYNLIEEAESLEAFKSDCEANDFTFTIDGKMENL